jgi:hypothetical protein
MDPMTLGEGEEQPRHDIAVSFAGEDRWYVTRLVNEIRDDYDVFLDEDYAAESWGEDGNDYFTDVYMNRTRYVLMFMSHKYAEKVWTNVERKAALAKAITQKTAYVLPVKLEDVQLPGMPHTKMHADARVLGLDGLVRLVREKLDGPDGGGDARPGELPEPPQFGWKVPQNPEQLQALLEAKPPGWEYILWAGALKMGMDALEGKYRDHAAGYASRTDGAYITDAHTYLNFTKRVSQEGLRISGNFGAILSAEVQAAAFGEPGVPGDADRILHMAQRTVDVYGDLMEWAAMVRGTQVSGEHARKALLAMAKASKGNVERFRQFVNDAVEWADGISQPREPDELYGFEMTVVLDLDDDYMAEYERERELAIDVSDPETLQ